MATESRTMTTPQSLYRAIANQMPRPVPRPYECVRRAWHSDSHQPLRGSIVQQIFRLVDEVHSPATKKNKEWHDKLPIVVLRAEKIVYSKANSEAEYMDLDTLWGRVKDAIDTIIRRDESTETGELLPPCVEAALNLCCTAVRAPRSQRHGNLRTYLSPGAQEPPSVHARTIRNPCSQLSPRQSSDLLNAKNSTTCLLAVTASNPNKHADHDTNLCLHENIPPGHNQVLTMETSHQLNLGSVYPLYYGTEYQRNESQRSMDTPARACSDTVFVGTPIVTSVPETAYSGLFWCLYSNVGAENAATRNKERGAYSSVEMLHEKQCDLSLRLSLLADPCVDGERNLACETKDLCPANSLGENLNQMSPQIDTQLFLYPVNTTHNSFGSGSTTCNLELEDQNLGPSFKKRKAPLW